MSKECSEEKHEAVNRHAVAALEVLLKDLEDKYGDEEYETEFLGDLYARMIVAAYMGFCPDLMGADAVEGKNRLLKLAQEHEDE